MAVFLGCALAHAQSPVATPQAGAAQAACPPARTVDELVQALDAAVSGLGNKDRACMQALLLPQARLIFLAPAKDGSITPHIRSLDDYIARSKARGPETLYEHQVKYSSQTFGRMAHVWSTFEIRKTPNGTPIARGINSIEAIQTEGSWHVLEVLWQNESAAFPLPADVLP